MTQLFLTGARRCFRMNAGILPGIKKVLLLHFLFWGQLAAAQQKPLFFENYSSEQGLSQNSCYAIAQDANGFMWFATQDGLNRYDGREFKVYLRQNGIGKKLPSNHITTLFFDDREKQLWIGSALGSCIYTMAGDSLQRVSELFPFAAMLDTLPVKEIISFKEKEYWIITFNNGLLCLDLQLNTLTPYFADKDDKANVTGITMHQDKLVVSTLYKLYMLKPGDKAYRPIPLYEKTSFPQINQLFSFENTLWIGTLSDGCYYVSHPIEDPANIHVLKTVPGGVNAFASDSSNSIWIGSRGSGIYRYNIKTGEMQAAVRKPYDLHSPATNFVVTAYKDRQGIVWFGLSGGIAKYDPLLHQFGHINEMGPLQNALPEKVIYKLYKSGDGKIYIGTQSHGIVEWNKTTGEVVKFPESARLEGVNNIVYDITENTDGHIWAATVSGLMELNPAAKKISYYRDPSFLALNRTISLLKLKNADSLLVASENGLLFFSPGGKKWAPFPENLQPGIYKDASYVYTARYMYEDENSTVWICTEGSGLLKYDYLKKTLSIVTPVNNISLFVRHMLKDGNLMWLATDNGLVVYDYLQNKVIQHLTPGGESTSRVCYATLKDNDGYFWVSTNFGLYKISAGYAILQHYSTSNGLTFLEYNTACALKEPNGTLYFGGMGGVTFFQPSLLRQNIFSPLPIITNVEINDTPWPVFNDKPAKLQLRYNENFLSIRFAVTNFSSEKNNQFSYRLKGLNDRWSDFSVNSSANFTSLPPGDYTFELMAANSDGLRSKGIVALAVTIQPPWWQTWWFRTLAILLLAGLITYFVRRRILSIKKEATLKQKIAEAEMMAMRAQMNPHFVFNSLNSIREMILSNENNEASHFLGKFARLIRITLDQSGKTFVPLRQTIDHLTRYIEIEQIRNEAFTCRILADDELDPDEVMLPSMLIQPFVENALWHGTTANRKNININVDFKKQGDRLLCIIEDDGIGIRQSLKNKINGSKTHHSVGLENVTNRIRLLNEKYKLKSSISINDKEDLDNYKGTGTVVQLFLLLQINE